MNIHLEGLMLKLNLQYSGNTMEKALMLGKIEGKRRRRRQRMRRVDGITNSMDMRGAGDGQGSLACCSSRGRKELNTTTE